MRKSVLIVATGMMRNRFGNQGKLPREAYNKSLDEVLEPYRKKEFEEKRKGVKNEQTN